jgi:hypothetical protein
MHEAASRGVIATGAEGRPVVRALVITEVFPLLSKPL